ncbi:MAG: YtxH domain-containing protein [Terriglobales bacterium]
MAEDNSNSFLWFLAGLGLGAVIGVLYAPQSGEETRETIRQKAEEGREFVVTRARQAREQANQWVDKGRDLYQQQKEQIRSAFEAGKQAYDEATSAEGPGGPRTKL